MLTPYVPTEDRYDLMTYRRCGCSGLFLPAVSLGLWQNFGDDRPSTTSVLSFDEPSTAGSPISISPTTTDRPTARPRRSSGGSWPSTCAPTATSWSSPPRPATTCGPARTGNGAPQVPSRQP